MHLYSIPFSNLLDPGTAVERFVFRKVGVKKKQKKKTALFQLIRKRLSKMNRIAIYQIHHTEGFWTIFTSVPQPEEEETHYVF